MRRERTASSSWSSSFEQASEREGERERGMDDDRARERDIVIALMKQ